MLHRTEAWKCVQEYVGLYEVSDLGRVRSLDRVMQNARGVTRPYRGRILEPGIDEAGRPKVGLCRNGERKNWKVCTLVLTAFGGPRPPGHECCHADGDPSNNQLENLRWDTRSANSYDSVEHGTHFNRGKLSCPRRHRLVEPNLSAYHHKRGARVCLSCERARNWRQAAKRRGEPFDFAAVADAIYAEIMGSAEDAA